VAATNPATLAGADDSASTTSLINLYRVAGNSSTLSGSQPENLANLSAGADRKTYRNLRRRPSTADNYSRRTLTGEPDRQAAVYLPSKPEIQDNAYYQELSAATLTGF
jgi:hypothetical protein